MNASEAIILAANRKLITSNTIERGLLQRLLDDLHLEFTKSVKVTMIFPDREADFLEAVSNLRVLGFHVEVERAPGEMKAKIVTSWSGPEDESPGSIQA